MKKHFKYVHIIKLLRITSFSVCIGNVSTETVLVLERVTAVVTLDPGPHGMVRDKVLPHVAGVRSHFPAQ